MVSLIFLLGGKILCLYETSVQSIFLSDFTLFRIAYEQAFWFRMERRESGKKEKGPKGGKCR